MIKYNQVAVVGAGSWGTALAHLASQNCEAVTLIPRSEEMARQINDSRQNPKYLTDLTLSENVQAVADLTKAVQAEVIILGVPTSAIRNTANLLSEAGLAPSTVLVSVAKGIERGSGKRMTEIIQEVLPENPVAVLSGPNHAEEVALDLPTCTVIGCIDEEVSSSLQSLLASQTFRSYTSQDLVGIEWGGAMKNIFAIAAGISNGLNLGDNAMAALVTRALAEMTRIGIEFGAQPETFAGLSGVGDLMTTCYSHHSRNHRVGLALAQGMTVDQACDQLGMVAEGVRNTQSIYEQTQARGLDVPLIQAVYLVIYQGVSPEVAIQGLFTRELKPEH